MKKLAKTTHCKNCNNEFSLPRRKTGRGFAVRTTCDDCVRKSKTQNIGLTSKHQFPISQKTKGELFEKRRNWQSARSSIRNHAVKVFFTANPNPCCKECGYSKHVEICHIKAVSEFPSTALISEINDLSNLMGLCPNHHWEFDNLK